MVKGITEVVVMVGLGAGVSITGKSKPYCYCQTQSESQTPYSEAIVPAQLAAFAGRRPCQLWQQFLTGTKRRRSSTRVKRDINIIIIGSFSQ